MSKIWRLKDTNFSTFAQKLLHFSKNYNIQKLNISDDKISFRWDRTILGLGFDVELEKIDDKTVLISYDQSSIAGLILTISIILLLILRNNLILFLASATLSAILLYLANTYTIEKNLKSLLEQIENQQLPQPEPQTDNKQNNILTCPACGEPLTEYDEVCPSCGLYLGKAWKKQPAHRTGLHNVRLVYQYKTKQD